MKQQPDNVLDARQEMRRRRRRRLRIQRISILLAVFLLVALFVTLAVLYIIGNQAAKRGETTTFLGVKAIQVEGETRYTTEELIQASGLYVGQSLLSINKVQATDALIRSFPYLCQVEIRNDSFDTLCITVKEAAVLGAVEAPDGWFVWGDNNHALELLPADGLPAEMLQIKGATLAGQTVGGPLLDERSLRICTTLVDSARRYGLTTMHVIDITEKTNIALRIGAGLEVLLGNETKLATQVQALVATLPTLHENNGADVDGRFDMTSYADDNPNNDRAI